MGCSGRRRRLRRRSTRGRWARAASRRRPHTWPATDGGLTPCDGCSLTNPFPQGFEQPQGAALGTADRRRRRYRLHRSVGGIRIRASVFDRPEARAARKDGGVGRIPGQPQRAPRRGWHHRRAGQHQPARSAIPGARAAPCRSRCRIRSSASPRSARSPRSPTIARGELLRPYPQFRNVCAHRVSTARARYNALTLGLERRQHDGWGARVNYMFSVRKDNQFGEGNAFRHQPSRGPSTTYDLEREFGYSLLDAPHRLNISGTIELPFGAGKRWLRARRRAGRARRWMGGQRRRQVSERLPDRRVPEQQQLQSARQRPAAEHRPRGSIRACPAALRTTTIRPATASDG